MPVGVLHAQRELKIEGLESVLLYPCRQWPGTDGHTDGETGTGEAQCNSDHSERLKKG